MVRPPSDEDALVKAREFALAGLFGALGLTLPVVFHALGWGGKVLLPMHLPITVAGFLVGPATAVALGVVVPFLSALLTGMPPIAPPIAPLMAAELAVKAGTASVLYRRLRFPLWVALPGALLADWLILGLAVFLAAGFFAIKASPLMYVAATVAVGLPGTILQVVAVPIGVAAVERRLPRLRTRRQQH